ncbi:hypothetical protein H310_03235 [Aphanomyces invadans]|uniref:N-acetyltransferase domain-containing protein n=1 Tax=Aphanomyces invadans TaxID=157072 RepID=A0A024UHZ2_9STRA|nr:hypothetical protein H310_03235 [Aphanomyces invadans]ETW05472.1 hypothetical protein H310_03235 [Aphanomyces invadans]|eukprot:XP_008865249.1 hypothetical protein H310_03235 [Aphanomyces invadans]
MAKVSPSTIEWTCSSFYDLTVCALYDILQLRANTFVVEMQKVLGDLDGHDQVCFHLVGRDQNHELVAYARLVPPHTLGPEKAEPSIGRVVVATHARGAGVGHTLVTKAIEVCQAHWPHRAIDVCGLATLEKFYTSLGFAKVSEPFDEQGFLCMNFRRQNSSGSGSAALELSPHLVNAACHRPDHL